MNRRRQRRHGQRSGEKGRAVEDAAIEGEWREYIVEHL